MAGIILFFAFFVSLTNIITAIKVSDKSDDKLYELNEKVVITCMFNEKPVKVGWMYNDKDIVKSEQLYPSGLSSGSQLVITKLTSEREGTYTCTGMDSSGSLASGDIKVTIRKKMPQINPLQDVYLVKDQNYSVKCSAIGPPDPTYTWNKINGLLNPTYVKDDGKGTLTILKMRKEDEGKYECEATNEKGKATKSLQLYLTNATKWLPTVDKDINIESGVEYKLVASLVSDRTPRFTWYKDSNLVIKKRYITTTSGSQHSTTLLIESATVADAGDYKVTVDGLITTMSKDFQITVWASPIVQIDRIEEIIKEGDPARFICRVNAHPTPSIKWMHNDQDIEPEALNQTRTNNGQRSSLTLHLPEVAKEDGGAYVCFASNNRGNGSSTVKLIVDVPVPDEDDNKTVLIVVIVVSVVVILLIVVFVFLYIKFKDRLFGKFSENGTFYTDLVQEEKDASCLADIENNPYAIKKNINISIRQTERSGSVGANPTIRLFSIGNRGGSTKGGPINPGLSFKNRSIKSPTSPTAEQHYAPLDAAITQGKAIEFKHIVFDELLGEGEYGIVNGGRIIDDTDTAVYKDVSIKMLKENYKAHERRDILAELRMMRRISRHPNVIAFIGWCTTDGNVYVVEEYAPFGSVLTFLRAQRSLSQSNEALDELPEEDRVDQETLLSFAWQVASGMKHLANSQIVHRDLACRNIYLGHEKTCKISEYGLARDIYSENVYRKTTGGQLPVRWMSYESVFKGQYTTASDVWSFGILMWELVMLGKIPYPGIVRTEQLLDDLESGYHMENPGHISTDLYLLMNSCWNREPESRPSFEKLQSDLGKLMKEQEEVHIDLAKLHRLEFEADDDTDLRSPTEDNRVRQKFKSIEEEDNEGLDSPDIIIADNVVENENNEVLG